MQALVYATVFTAMVGVFQRRKILINSFKKGDTYTIQLYILLIIVTGMMLKIGTNRAAIVNLAVALWAPIIISTILTETSTTQELPRGIYPMLAILIVILILTSQYIEPANLTIIFYAALILAASAILQNNLMKKTELQWLASRWRFCLAF